MQEITAVLYPAGTVEYGCVFSVFRSTNSETVRGPSEGPLLTGYFSVPVGCSYVVVVVVVVVAPE
jgi:hypothetical protein